MFFSLLGSAGDVPGELAKQGGDGHRTALLHRRGVVWPPGLLSALLATSVYGVQFPRLPHASYILVSIFDSWELLLG